MVITGSRANAASFGVYSHPIQKSQTRRSVTAPGLQVAQPFHGVQFGAKKVQPTDQHDPFKELKAKGYQVGTLAPDKSRDLKAVVNFIEDVFGGLPPNQSRDQYTSIFKETLERGALTYIIRPPNEPEKIAGTATLTKEGYIFSVGVEKAHRRNHMATAMMQGLLAQAKTWGLKQVGLKVEPNNEAAIQAYKKQGFIRMHQVGEDGEDVMLNPFTPGKRLWCHVQAGFNWLLGRVLSLLTSFFETKAKSANEANAIV
jgi:RimJ/RimL family protein N-acetyltransferase